MHTTYRQIILKSDLSLLTKKPGAKPVIKIFKLRRIAIKIFICFVSIYISIYLLHFLSLYFLVSRFPPFLLSFLPSFVTFLFLYCILNCLSFLLFLSISLSFTLSLDSGKSWMQSQYWNKKSLYKWEQNIIIYFPVLIERPLFSYWKEKKILIRKDWKRLCSLTPTIKKEYVVFISTTYLEWAT